jgi:hypothetical protein
MLSAVHGDGAALDLYAAAFDDVALRVVGEDAGQCALGGRTGRRLVDRRLLQRAQAPVVVGGELQHVAVRLDQRDCRQEARALQAVAIEVARRRVGGRHQRNAALEQRFEQAGQDHRVADVLDQEFVQAQHAAAHSDAGGDFGQRIAALAERAQALVDVFHEAMEMSAQRQPVRQSGGEQVHQEGLAAADAAPQVQAGGRFDIAAEQRLQAPEQAVVRVGQGAQRIVQAIQFGQCRALRRVVLPAAVGDAFAVARAGRKRPGLAQAPRSGGSQARTPFFTAPRRSISRRWK